MDNPSDTLRDFAAYVSTDAPDPKQRARRRGNGSDRAAPDAAGSGAAGQAPTLRGNGSDAGTVAAPAPAEDRDGATVMRYIASLSGRKDRFRELETALWENVDVLVPQYMSMAVWTQSLQSLRDSNRDAESSNGGNEDPLAAIRQFLKGEVVQ